MIINSNFHAINCLNFNMKLIVNYIRLLMDFVTWHMQDSNSSGFGVTFDRLFDTVSFTFDSFRESVPVSFASAVHKGLAHVVQSVVVVHQVIAQARSWFLGQYAHVCNKSQHWKSLLKFRFKSFILPCGLNPRPSALGL